MADNHDSTPTPPEENKMFQVMEEKPRSKFFTGLWWSLQIALILFGVNYLVMRATGDDYAALAMAKLEPLKSKIEQEWERRHLVRVSEKDFMKLFKEICPELLAKHGTPLAKVYEDMLRQYEGELIDEALVRKLLEDLGKQAVVYDGNGFFRMDGERDEHAPDKPINPEFMKKDKVSVKFYLDNLEFYSKNIFRTLTKQNRVRFALKIDQEGRYEFEALENMTQAEFFAIVSTQSAPEPDRRVEKGDSWNIPPDQLREISRIYEIEKNFTDHRGKKRAVTVSIDLMKYDSITAKISVLPDGTVLADEHGALHVNRDKLRVQRVDGKLRTDGSSWTYHEDGELLFRTKNRRCVYNKFASCDKTERVDVYIETETIRNILVMTIDEGTTSLISRDGTTYRLIDPWGVKDGNDNEIADKNDIGVKFQQQIVKDKGVLTIQPNLDMYVQTGPLMQKLVHDITAPYQSEDEKAQALLAFVQSLKYERGMVLGQAKTPKDSLISLEGDCEDGSVFTVSLWATAGYKAGFLYFKNKKPKEAGHAVAMMSKSSCCSGKGVNRNGESWLYGESTDAGWKIGEDGGYAKMNLVPHIFQPHGGSPVRL